MAKSEERARDLKRRLKRLQTESATAIAEMQNRQDVAEQLCQEFERRSEELRQQVASTPRALGSEALEKLTRLQTEANNHAREVIYLRERTEFGEELVRNCKMPSERTED